MNKPELIDFGNGEKILYLYDANGTKLGKKVMNGNVTAAGSLIYAGNFIYSWSGALQFIQTEEGRLVPEAAGMRAEYAAKDHLGNTRATFACAVPGVPQVMEYHHYYPFGMTLEALDFSTQAHPVNKFLYNTKELQDDYGLQWYDYGARFYDPQLGRWHAVDPYAAKHRELSPYSFCNNNPLKYIDKDGRDWNVSVSKARDGNLTILFRFTAAVLNSSSTKTYSTKIIAKQLEKQLQNVLQNSSTAGFTVVSEIKIRGIINKNELRRNEHLLEIVNSQDIPDASGESSYYGKHIKLSQNILQGMMSDMPSGLGEWNKKTGPHEALHTAGLVHPFEKSNIYTMLRYDNNINKQFDQPEQFDPHNVMNYENNHYQQRLSKKQMEIIFDNYINSKLNKDDIKRDE